MTAGDRATGPERDSSKVVVALIAATIGAVALGYSAVQLFFLPETVARSRLDRVPDLTGASIDEAIDEGRGSGYEVIVAGRQHDEDVEAGRVLFQIPQPDTYLPPGDTLRLLVSDGAGTMSMPDLAGLEPELADRVLGWLGLSIAGTRHGMSDLVPQETVIETVPPAGVPVEKGTGVTLVLSRGGSFLVMPDVRNISLAAARDTLESYALTVGEISEVPEVSSEERRVVVTGQTPAAGQRTRAGTAVTLQLGETRAERSAARVTAPPRREELAQPRDRASNGPQVGTPGERPPGQPPDEPLDDRFEEPPPSLDEAAPPSAPFEDVPAVPDTTGGGA